MSCMTSKAVEDKILSSQSKAIVSWRVEATLERPTQLLNSVGLLNASNLYRGTLNAISVSLSRKTGINVDSTRRWRYVWNHYSSAVLTISKLASGSRTVETSQPHRESINRDSHGLFACPAV
ncbi:unnamed protein product [Cercospora beticola]|nr:unnamed protein product [Cercospora beticola]